MIGVGVSDFPASVMRGHLPSVMITVRDKMINDVEDTRVIRLTGCPTKMNHHLEVGVDQLTIRCSIRFEALDQLITAQEGEPSRGVGTSIDPVKPHALPNHQVREQLARPLFGLGLRINELDPRQVRPDGVLDQSMQCHSP